MIKARQNLLIGSILTRYVLYKMQKNFRSVKFFGEYKSSDKAILLISNHISWWDGFWAMYLNRKIFCKNFYFMMLEEQLKKFWFFRYAGGFSVKRNTKSVMDTLNYTEDLLNDKRNMVLIFPQGKINSVYKQKFDFEKGVDRIASDLQNNIKIIFLANIIDYGSYSKPGVYLYFQEFKATLLTITSMQDNYQIFYNQTIESHISIIE